ncbi:hypothetical protein GCM10010339_84130 [Streptomyces alanosinicus]|uniref:Transposase n=1 Tax=Streptomyces alanosinicus TaxID=68171 RepID=A0A919D8V9_9ACTN|nr:hypothetical protein GCM10010339_84130 [Streptomyces alanosinicus]
MGRHRWTVERTVAWPAGCRRRQRRYECKPEHFLAFVGIAAALICYRRLAPWHSPSRDWDDPCRPYDWVPGWLNLYWSSLAVLDPLAAAFLLNGKHHGADLAAPSWRPTPPLTRMRPTRIQHSGLLAQPGPAKADRLCAAVLGATPFLHKHLTN